MLALLLTLALQSFEPFPPTPFDRVIPITLDEHDLTLAGHGRAERVTYKAEFSGTLHLWTKSAGELDLFLRVETPSGELVQEDDDSGGVSTPYVKLEVEAGRELVIVTAVSKGEGVGSAELCAIAAPETKETRAAAEASALALVEIKRLREAKEFEAAREHASEAIDACLAHAEGSWSELAASTMWSLGFEAGGLSILRPTMNAQSSVLRHRSRTLPEDHPDLQKARANLAIMLYSLGDLPGAQALFEGVLEVFTRTLPEDHPDLQAARLNLAATIASLGDLPGARALEERVLEVRSRTLPEDHPHLQMARLNLAATIAVLGDHAGARALLEGVLEVFTRTLPEDHREFQAARQNLAQTIKALGDLPGARVLEEGVLEVFTRTLPEDHPDLQAARQNLAGTIYSLGDLHGARALQERVLEVRSRTLPEDHHDLQMARLNLAATIQALGDLHGARALFEGVLEVLTRTLPEDHPNLQAARRNLAVTALKQASGSWRGPGAEEEGATEMKGASERGAALLGDLSRANACAARELRLSAPGREAEERCAGLGDHLGFTLSAALGFGGLEPLTSLRPSAFEYSEAMRNAAVSSSALGRRASRAEGYSEARARLRSATDELARLVQAGTDSEGYRKALAEREEAEKGLLELGRKASGGKATSVELDLATLSATVEPGILAVAFRRFTRIGREGPAAPNLDGLLIPTDTFVESLCAFIVRPREAASTADATSSLMLLDLGPLEPITAAIAAWREALGAGEGRGLSVHSRAAETALPSLGAQVRRLVFDPLRAALGDAQRVVVVLDGPLQLVPLDALPATDDDTKRLGDTLRIETRTTLGELLDVPLPLEGQNVLVGLGGAEFDGSAVHEEPESPDPAQASAVIAAAEPTTPAAVPAILRGSAFGTGFGSLPGTLHELEGLEQEFIRSLGVEGTLALLRGNDATKEALLAAAPRARWLHIATHGWFAPESIRSWEDRDALDSKSSLVLRASGEETVKGMSPMMLCGLALAGANLPDDAVGRAPGLLTADELSTLDLSNCELAVLSACDTARGEMRRAGQGVASLQKALQIAGARSVITSLWKVPDEATKELMLDFYRRVWVEKKPKWQALWEAKTRLREAKDERGNPKYMLRDWAAWVLTGEPN